MKASVRSAAKGVRVILALGAGFAAYLIYAAGWGAPEPAWAPREHRTMYLGCYTEEGDGGDVAVQFTDRGHKAVVESRGERAELIFEAGGMAGDQYRGDGVTFKYDGEGHLSGMEGGSRGPCQ